MTTFPKVLLESQNAGLLFSFEGASEKMYFRERKAMASNGRYR